MFEQTQVVTGVLRKWRQTRRMWLRQTSCSRRPRASHGTRGGVKKRLSFLIDHDLLERLRTLKLRTGLSDSEQIRQAIRMWLDSHEWPTRSGRKEQHARKN